LAESDKGQCDCPVFDASSLSTASIYSNGNIQEYHGLCTGSIDSIEREVMSRVA
jgi:hypothetical protein